MADRTVDTLRANLQAIINAKPLQDAQATAEQHEANGLELLKASASMFNQASLENQHSNKAIACTEIARNIEALYRTAVSMLKL